MEILHKPTKPAPKPPPSKAVMAAKLLDATSDGVDKVLHSVQAISAAQAFRKYNWLKNVPAYNKSGNLRGMVVSGRWKSVFTVIGPYAEAAGNIAFVASFAANATEQFDEMEAVWKSKDTWENKGAKLSLHVSSIAARTLGGVVKGGAHILSLSLQGYCGIAAIAMGKSGSDNKGVKALKAGDAWISTTVDKVTDANNMYYAVTVVVTPIVNRLMQ